jgi:ketosteroid isomerase-like protein
MSETSEKACARIYEQWHEYTRNRQAEQLIDLYADDAILETPLVTAVLDDKKEGILRGRAEIMHFFEEGLRRRPDDLLRWYKTASSSRTGRSSRGNIRARPRTETKSTSSK